MKGQVSLFVIIGIVLLGATGLVIMLSEDTTIDHVEKQIPVESVSDDVRPVQEYVQTCMQVIGRDGLDLIGVHGGYIDPPQEYHEEQPLDSAVIMFGENQKIPYWLYSGKPVESDNIAIQFGIPSVNYIQKDHARYIDQHLLECINSFNDPSYPEGIRVLDSPSSIVTYTSERVAIKTNLTIEVPLDGGTKKIDSFVSFVDVPFLKYYFSANAITYQAYGSQYLENMVLALIGFYGRIDSDAIPPFTGQVPGFSTVSWSEYTVDQRMRELLRSYIPLFQINGTKDVVPLTLENTTPQEENFYNAFTLPLIVAGGEELRVDHLYLDWPTYVHVTPSESGVIGPISDYADGIANVPPEQDNSYRFYYDVTFPVVITLREENLPGNEDYTFMFALEANIRNNLRWIDYARGEGPIPYNYGNVNIDLGDMGTVIDPLNQDEVELNVDVGDSWDATDLQTIASQVAGFEPRTTQLRTPTQTLFSNSQTFTSGNLSVDTFDGTTGRPLEGVRVGVGVSDYAFAPLGQTVLKNGFATLSAKGPLFKNGYLSLKKQGYMPYYEPLTLEENTPKNIGSKRLFKIQEKNVTFEVLHFYRVPVIRNGVVTYTLNSTLRNITAQETALVTIEYQGAGLGSYSQVVVYSNESTNTINIVPGRYSISGRLIDENGITIPKECKKICSGVVCWFTSITHIPTEKIDLPNMPWGGVEFNESNSWFVTANNVYDNNTLVIRLIKFEQPTCFESLEKMNQLGRISARYRTQLTPKFK